MSLSLPIPIICGATASGKSAFAMKMAHESSGVIINCDAMQVYRELRILSARPTLAEEAEVPHLLYGYVPVNEKYSVSKWLQEVQLAIRDTLIQGKLPIITGGTGMYIKALREGLSPIPEIAPLVRTQAERLWEEDKEKALLYYDKAMAEQLMHGDKQRHIRALEVILATGKSLRYWQAIPRIKPFADQEFAIHYIKLERTELYERCNNRFLQMLEKGALQEAQAIFQQHLPDDLPAKRAVGLKELLGYCNKEYALEEAIGKAQQATRNYAKRQITWFNHQLD